MLILEACRVSYKYNDNITALNNINFCLQKGQFAVLLGPNGSGKTTFFKVLTGLLNGSGEINLFGKPIQDYLKEELYRRIGLVFQDPNDQLFAPTVAEDVAFGPANLGLSEQEVRTRVSYALEVAGIGELADRPIHYLSYGQKKRTAIAGVLAMEPDIIILDEPTAGLDPAGVREIMKLLAQLNREKGISILMATHDVDLVPIYAQSVSVMSNGETVVSGTPREVFTDKKAVREVGLRLPRIAHLAEILANRDNVSLDYLPLTIGEARQVFVSALRSGCLSD